MAEPTTPSEPSYTYPGADEPPRYGERVPGYVPPAPAPHGAPPAPSGVPAPGYAYGPGPVVPGVRGRRAWDLALTIVLLVLGLIGMIIGLGYAAVFADPALFSDAMSQQGYDISVDTRGAGVVIAVSHVALYLIAVGGSIPLLVTRRIAFWLPLSAGVLAAIIFWATLFVTIASAPGVLSQFGAP